MKTKRQTFTDLLPKGAILVHLDPRLPEVEVPDDFKNTPELRLNFNYTFGSRNLQVTSWGLRETLRFHGDWKPVAVPWSAVMAMWALGTKDLISDFEPDEPLSETESDLERIEQLKIRLAKYNE